MLVKRRVVADGVEKAGKVHNVVEPWALPDGFAQYNGEVRNAAAVVGGPMAAAAAGIRHPFKFMKKNGFQSRLVERHRAAPFPESGSSKMERMGCIEKPCV